MVIIEKDMCSFIIQLMSLLPASFLVKGYTAIRVFFYSDQNCYIPKTNTPYSSQIIHPISHSFRTTARLIRASRPWKIHFPNLATPMH